MGPQGSAESGPFASTAAGQPVRAGADPAISVVVPSLDSGPFIERAVSSALDQTGVELEVLVQDGGSRDGTHAALERLADPRLRVESRPDCGQAAAINRAIDRSRGTWIAWLNADDELIAGALATALERAPMGCEVVIGDFATIDGAGRLLKQHRTGRLDQRRLLADGCYAFSGAMLIRRAVFERFGPLDERLHHVMDYEYFLRVSSQVESAHIPRTLANYRDHAGSKTRTERWAAFREAGAVRRSYAGSMQPPPAWRLGQAKLGAYYLSRRIWMSDWWLRRRTAPRS